MLYKSLSSICEVHKVNLDEVISKLSDYISELTPNTDYKFSTSDGYMISSSGYQKLRLIMNWKSNKVSFTSEVENCIKLILDSKSSQDRREYLDILIRIIEKPLESKISELESKLTEIRKFLK